MLLSDFVYPTQNASFTNLDDLSLLESAHRAVSLSLFQNQGDNKTIANNAFLQMQCECSNAFQSSFSLWFLFFHNQNIFIYDVWGKLNADAEILSVRNELIIHLLFILHHTLVYGMTLAFLYGDAWH